ncbi:MAG: glycosyltransferase [Dehalobacter sp.]|nr:glycosyltransferase [Dehalobacter sp.]
MKKKILVITSNYPRFDKDSYGWFVHELNRRLSYKGMEIKVLAPHTKSAKFTDKLDGITVYRFPYFIPLSLQKLTYGSGIAFNLKKSFLAKVQVPLFFVMQTISTIYITIKYRFDAIHSHWLLPQGLVGCICKKALGVQHIVTIHSSEVTLVKKIPLGKKITEFILNNSDAIISVSSHRIDELLNFISPKVADNVCKKVSIIPMGVQIKKICNNTDSESFKSTYGINSKYVILFVGRLVEVKGCEYLIRAFKSVVEERDKDIQLVIVGNGPLEDSLKNMAIELGINKNIIFKGYVDHDRIADYFGLSDIVVFPSIVDSSGFQEGLPVVLIEALSAGKPVIATNTKGVLEVIENGYNGIIVEQKNGPQIAEEIDNVIKDSELRSKLSVNALEYSNKFGWDNISGQYMKTLESVLGDN